MQTTTPPQADTDRTRRRTFRADESADRTRHSSAPTYSTLTAVPAEPPSTWRERNIEWVTGPFDDLGRSLPDIVPVPILNEHGVEHRLAAFMACHWPENGALSTPARTQWSNVPTGIGASWPPPVQPRDAARAFRTMVAQQPQTGSRRADRRADGPDSWTLGIADDGEWYTLRAGWNEPDAQEGHNLERWIAIEHETHSNQIQVNTGVRDRDTGAVIPMYPTPVRIHRGRITDPADRSSAPEYRATVLKMAATAVDMLAVWSRIEIPDAWLRTWATSYIAPYWGSPATTDAVRPTEGKLSAADLAWRLAEANNGIMDIEERKVRNEHLCTTIEELAHQAGTLSASSNTERRTLAASPEAGGVH